MELRDSLYQLFRSIPNVDEQAVNAAVNALTRQVAVQKADLPAAIDERLKGESERLAAIAKDQEAMKADQEMMKADLATVKEQLVAMREQMREQLAEMREQLAEMNGRLKGESARLSIALWAIGFLAALNITVIGALVVRLTWFPGAGV